MFLLSWRGIHNYKNTWKVYDTGEPFYGNEIPLLINLTAQPGRGQRLYYNIIYTAYKDVSLAK